MPCLSSVIARKSPSANETSTVDVAKTNVQTKTRRNGLRYSGSVDELAEVVEADVGLPARLELVLGSPSTNEPRPLSVKTAPSLIRTNWFFAAS